MLRFTRNHLTSKLKLILENFGLIVKSKVSSLDFIQIHIYLFTTLSQFVVFSSDRRFLIHQVLCQEILNIIVEIGSIFSKSPNIINLMLPFERSGYILMSQMVNWVSIVCTSISADRSIASPIKEFIRTSIVDICRKMWGVLGLPYTYPYQLGM